MRLRSVERADLPELASISAAAFIDDVLFDALTPRRREFPADYERSFLTRHKLRLVTPRTWGIVCVSDESDTDLAVEPGSILGLAWWERETKPGLPSSKWTRNNASLFHALERGLLRVEQVYEEYLQMDRAVDAAAVAAFNAEFDSHDPFASVPEMWYLSHLVVRPECQRKGIGGRLVQWGVDRAREEGILATLTSSPAGREVYTKRGFRMIDAHHIPGQSFGDPAMVFDPTEKWIQTIPTGEVVLRLGLQMQVRWSPLLLENMRDNVISQKV